MYHKNRCRWVVRCRRGCDRQHDKRNGRRELEKGGDHGSAREMRGEIALVYHDGLHDKAISPHPVFDAALRVHSIVYGQWTRMLHAKVFALVCGEA